jgi:hypothetical protein
MYRLEISGIRFFNGPLIAAHYYVLRLRQNITIYIAEAFFWNMGSEKRKEFRLHNFCP